MLQVHYESDDHADNIYSEVSCFCSPMLQLQHDLDYLTDDIYFVSLLAVNTNGEQNVIDNLIGKC